MKRAVLGAVAVIASLAGALADPNALDATSVTGGVAVVAVRGPVSGCSIIPGTTSLIIDLVGTAGTAAAGTSVLQPTGSVQGFLCGPLNAQAHVSVNCLGCGACTWTGYKY
jgi:hypothetical protein